MNTPELKPAGRWYYGTTLRREPSYGKMPGFDAGLPCYIRRTRLILNGARTAVIQYIDIIVGTTSYHFLEKEAREVVKITGGVVENQEEIDRLWTGGMSWIQQ